MSIIKEINDLNDSLKSIALSLLLIPFWFVSFYLFDNVFYKTSDIYIILSMAFILSETSSLLLTNILGALIHPIENDNKMAETATIAVAILSFWISLLIFVFYSLGFLFNIYIYFYYYIIIYYLSILVIQIIIIFSEKHKYVKKE